MAEIINAKTINQIEIDARVGWPELEQLISQAVAQAILKNPEQIDGFSCGEFRVEITQQSEGSPAYKVSKWDARVKVILKPDPPPLTAGALDA